VVGKSKEDVVVVIDGNNGEVSIKKAPETKNTLLEADNLVEQWNGDGKLSKCCICVTLETGAKEYVFRMCETVFIMM